MTMKDIYIKQAEFEKCALDKEKIDTVPFYNSIHYIIDGYGYFNGMRLGKGQYFCMLEKEKSSWYPDPHEPWSYYYFDIYGTNAANIIQKHGFVKDNIVGSFSSLGEIEHIASMIKEHCRSSNLNINFLSSAAMLLLSLHEKTDTGTGMKETEKHVNEIKDYIDHNFHLTIKIENLASQMYLSRAYVRNIFFEYMNLSPKAYLQKVRLEHAISLLINTDYSIAVISKSVGYEDQLAFSKIFKKTYGVSPTDYRDHRNQIDTGK